MGIQSFKTAAQSSARQMLALKIYSTYYHELET